MQPSACPELPHTRTRAVHWLATAAALAATVAAGALIQPPHASATVAESPAEPVGAPDPHPVHYPLNCAGAPVDVVSSVSADLDGDGRPETVAVVRCHSDTGTPPSGVYVLSQGPTPGAAPRIVATLLDPAQKLGVTGFGLSGRTVSATLLGYSSDAVPRCCPDRQRKFSWTWRDGVFPALPGPHAGSV